MRMNLGASDSYPGMTCDCAGRCLGSGSGKGPAAPADRPGRPPRPAVEARRHAATTQELPELPARYADAADSMEQVHECQSPLFLAVEVDDAEKVQLFFSAPPEAPTTRGFASIMHTGLDGESAADVLAVPDARTPERTR
ncbi:SufE family protein [Micrococcus luteus]